jgi:molecular chaperone GrpE (heat shock protein)
MAEAAPPAAQAVSSVAATPTSPAAPDAPPSPGPSPRPAEPEAAVAPSAPAGDSKPQEEALSEPKTAEPSPASRLPAEPTEPPAEEVTLESLLKAASAANGAPEISESRDDSKAAPPPPSPSKPAEAGARSADSGRLAIEAPSAEIPHAETEAHAKEAPRTEAPTAPATGSAKVPAAAVAPARKPAAPTPAPRPAPPPVNVGAVVKGELVPVQKSVDHLERSVEHVEKSVEHVGKSLGHVETQIKAGLTLVAKGQRGLEEKVTLIARAIEELAKDAQKRRKDYDALYVEMRDYKTNFLDTAQKPLFNDLLLLFDSVQRITRRVDEITEPAIPKEAVVEAFKQVKDELLEILYRRDLELIEDHPAKLDVAFQKPVRRVETEDAKEDKDVLQCVREGFRRNGVLFRAQDVVVKRCLAVASDEQPITEDADDGGASETSAGEAQPPAPETPVARKEEQ